MKLLQSKSDVRAGFVAALVNIVLSVAVLFGGSVAAYSVVNGKLMDTRGQAIQLRGLNWFGFETDTHAPHGLWARPWAEMLDQMQAMDANALRIPLCPETIRGVPIKGVDGDLNPDLIGFNSAELLDFLVRKFSEAGFYVLLDHHRPNCQSQSELWYTNDYSEEQWINDLTELARRFRDVPGVIGIDLKNEPKGRATWGTGNAKTDWNAAAERASRAVLEIAPQWLIFVEGVESNPECSSEGPHFWGENLEPFACTPLDIPPDRLVLAPHTYGPDVYPQPFFDDPRFPANMPEIWERNFGQFLGQGYSVILGEFGGKYGEGDPRDRAWQDMLVDYLLRRDVNSGFYWSWNPNSEDTGGLLQDDWKTLREDKVALLHRLWFGASASSAKAQPRVNQKKRPRGLPSPAVNPKRGTAAMQRKLISEWGEGYCEEIQLSNPSASALAWQVNLPVAGDIQQLWNARITGAGDAAQFEGADWNAVIKPGEQASFGLCVRGSRLVGEKSSASQVKQSGNRSSSKEPITVVDAPVVSAKVTYDSDWGEGYCARIEVWSQKRQPQDWQLALNIEGEVENLWQGRWSQNGQRLEVRGEDYNRVLQPNATVSFGFCARR